MSLLEAKKTKDLQNLFKLYETLDQKVSKFLKTNIKQLVMTSHITFILIYKHFNLLFTNPELETGLLTPRLSFSDLKLYP
ncbi:hypothetical protein Hanom_Chr17g01554171 [Helianthus anomalus]